MKKFNLIWVLLLFIPLIYASDTGVQQDIANSTVVSYWRFEETGTASDNNITDYKGVANSTTINGTVVYSIDGFDGVGKGINVTDGASIIFGDTHGATEATHVWSSINLSNWTYIVRFYTGFNTGKQRNFLTGHDDTDADFFKIGEDGNFLSGSWRTNGAPSHISGAEDINPTNNTWHLFVIVSNSITGINMSLDAAEFRTSSSDAAKHVVNFTKPMDLRLNIRTNPSSSDETLYDDIAILNISLNSSQIHDLNDTEFIELIIGHTAIAADTTPPEITAANLTSEATEQGINLTFPLNTSIPTTTDLTPTFDLETNEAGTCAVIDLNRNLNYTDIFIGNANEDTGAGTLSHTVTLNLTNQTTIGLRNFSLSCKDTTGNENLTATLFFTINITPDITLPTINVTFNKSIGNIFEDDIINFTANVTDETALDNGTIIINDTGEVRFFNFSLTGTEDFFSQNITVSCSTGCVINFTARVNDTSGNTRTNDTIITVTETPAAQPVNITLLLDGINQSRKYEFETTVNLTILSDKYVRTCLNEGDNINLSCATGINWSYYFNITELRVEKLINQSKRFNISGNNDNIPLKIDNQTTLIRFTLNTTGYEVSSKFPSNITIDVDKRGDVEVVMPGKLRGKTLETDNFIFNNKVQDIINISFSSGTIISLSINASNVNSLNNFSMRLSGGDLDVDNEFKYIEYFNGTDGSSGFNQTLSFHTDAPLGVFDEFINNVSGRWDVDRTTGENVKLQYDNSKFPDDLHLEVNDGGEIFLDYSNSPAADFRNTSLLDTHVEYDLSVASCSDNCGTGTTIFRLYATDGTSRIQLYQALRDGIGPGPASGEISNYNFSLSRVSTDDTVWRLDRNGTSLGNKDISSLDFSKQIKLEYSLLATDGLNRNANAIVVLFRLNWGGAWLNRSTNNGTYKSSGNVTSNLIQTTTTNVSRATLTKTDFQPTGTKIDYYLSNTCTNTTARFESVQSGVLHTFSTTGNQICWRATLNSSINITSPVVRKVEVEVISASLANISVDFGDDGDVDWNFPGVLNSTTSPRIVNGSLEDFNIYKFENCKGFQPTCQYPISISTVVGGTLEISKVNTTIIVGDINFNLTKIENHSIINLTVNTLNGLLEIGDMILSFKGSKNFTFMANSIPNSTLLESIDNKTVEVLYSPFNVTYPFGINLFNIFVSATPSNESILNENSINPFGQIIRDLENQSLSIFNISTTAYDNKVYVAEFLNQSLNSCITIEVGPFFNQTNTSVLDNETLSDVAISITPNMLNGTKLYHYVNLTNCNVSQNIFFEPTFCFNSWCQDCVRTGLLESNKTINPNGLCQI